MRGERRLPMRRPGRARPGFTLIEMMVVLAILGVLAAAARPLLELAAKRQREFALHHGLRQIRVAIDAYELAVAKGTVPRPPDAPKGGPVYPQSLRQLVEGVATSDEAGAPRRYFLRRLPRDPFADPELPADETWGLRASDSAPDAPMPGKDVFDVHSRAAGIALDGTRYREW
jgi:general secretion pathway protein G